jgi:hypothetical protein
MAAIVTIFKSEFIDEKKHLIAVLEALAKETQHLNDVLIFRPSSGGLMKFLNYLKENGIAYGAHFDTMPPDL